MIELSQILQKIPSNVRNIHCHLQRFSPNAFINWHVQSYPAHSRQTQDNQQNRHLEQLRSSDRVTPWKVNRIRNSIKYM